MSLVAGGMDGLSLGVIAAGSVFLYAGLKGYSVPGAIQAVISGQAPSAGGQANPITWGAGTPSSQGISGSPLAQDLLDYVGKVPYVWGKATPSGWDCSGAVNWVASHAGLAIPGYAPHAFTGASHGPTTWGWLAWAPGRLTRISAANVQAGDLVIWQTHMGIAINAAQYVSAYDTAEGTVVHDIHGGGPIGEVATYWRYPSGTAANPNPLTGVST